MERLRHNLRYVVNALALAAAVLTLPQFGAVVPADWLPEIAGIAAGVNTVLSWLRGLV